MRIPTFFIHECPICGRQLQVRVEYLGAKVSCPHCHGDFDLAREGKKNSRTTVAPSLLARADHLLSTLDTASHPG